MLEKFINNLKKKDTFNSKIHSSIIDKYTNGECEALVGYLLQLNNFKGEHIKIYLIGEDEEGNLDFEDKIYHAVYKFKNNYYDINGKFENINDLIEKLPYYDKEEHTIEISSREVDKNKNFYPKIPKNLMIKKTNKNIVKN